MLIDTFAADSAVLRRAGVRQSSTRRVFVSDAGL